MDDKAEKVALFRYGLIAPLVLETLPRGELTRRAQELAARLYDIPHSTRRQVSVDTLLDWTLRYRRNGLAALSPKPRQDRGQTRAVAPGGYVTPMLTDFLLNRRSAIAVGEEGTPLAALTPAERAVLRLVAEYKTSKQIAEDLFISIRTVERHRSNIAAKLELAGSHALLQFALEHKVAL